MVVLINPVLTRNTLVASQKEVYKLEPRPYDQQESMFVNGRQFELALQISVSWNFSGPCANYKLFEKLS